MLLAVVFVGLIVGAALESRDRTRHEAMQRGEADRVGVETFQEINELVTRQALGLSRLTAAAEVLPELDEIAFQDIAQSIVLDVGLFSAELGTPSFIMSVSYAPEMVITNTYPIEKNRYLLGVDYNTLSDQIKDIEKTLTSFVPTVSHPFETIQGKTAIAIREVVLDDLGKPRGLASIAIDVDAFISHFKDRVLKSHGYLIEFGVDGPAFTADLGSQWRSPEKLKLRTHGLDWTLAIVPVGGWSDLPFFTASRLGISIATAFLLLAVHLRFVRHQQSRQIVERLEKGMDALAAGFVIYDSEDRLLHWNDTYSELFGYGDTLKRGITFEEILRSGLNRGLYRVPRDDQNGWVQDILERHHRSDDAAEIELANGRWIRALSRRTEDGDRVGVRFDITDIKHAQMLAERSSAAKSEFISLISHELRTPLTVILGFSKLLQLKSIETGTTERDNFVGDSLNRVVTAGEGLLKLVNNMLDYTNLKSGTSRLCPSVFDVRDIMSRAADRVSGAAALKSVSIEVHADSAPITADPLRVAQILDHLLDNAVKFTKPGGVVTFRSEVELEKVKIKVTDTGPGIPEDKLDIIFDEFAQLEPTGTRREGGTGLGLAIAKCLATMHGGDILVESQLSHGSTFTLLLPRLK